MSWSATDGWLAKKRSHAVHETAPSTRTSRRRLLTDYAAPLGIFLCTRIIDAVLLVLLARDQVSPGSLGAPAPGHPPLTTGPTYFDVIANWDGQWYRQIVEHGYPTHLPTFHGVVEGNAWAFYPGYPALVRLVMFSGAPFGVAASLVSLAAGAAAMCLLFSMLRRRCGGFVAGVTVLALCCAPAAPVFQAAYTESLGLLLVLLALWCLDKGRYGGLVITALALALTRPITAPLALVVAGQWLVRWHRREREPFPVGERWQLLGAGVALAGFALIWPLVAGLVVGDVSAYGDTERAWRTFGGNQPDTWLGSLLHGAPLARWLFVLALAGVLIAIAWRARAWTHGTRGWTVAYPVFILAVNPPAFSIFRYALLIGAASWPLPGVGDRVGTRSTRLLLVTSVLVLGVALQFLWLRWYFVLTPDARGAP
jgi:hypothetical protein